MHKRLPGLALAGILVVAIVVAGCGAGGGSPATIPATSPKTTPSAKTTLSVFFMKGEVATQVMRQAENPTVQAALNDMLQGPNEAEKEKGFTTAIPAGTKLQAYSVSGGRATADFSKEILNYGGGSARVQAIVSQVDNTVLNNDKTVSAVDITVDGVPAEEVLQP